MEKKLEKLYQELKEKHDVYSCFVTTHPSGKNMLFSDERIADNEIPEGFYKAEIRNSDFEDKWSTIEPNVYVNFGGTLISDKPFKFKKHKTNSGYDEYIEITDYDVDWENYDVITDMYSKEILVGDKVIWHDPAGESEDTEYEVYDIDYENGILKLSNEFGECEAFPHECKKI